MCQPEILHAYLEVNYRTGMDLSQLRLRIINFELFSLSQRLLNIYKSFPKIQIFKIFASKINTNKRK
jgi:hypothetical protein